jgi:type II secretory pathway pseudopilin PulG
MNRKNTTYAFSLLEAVLAIAALGILAAVAIGHQGTSLESVRVAKLKCDLATINSALRIYVANGGSVNGLTDPQSILDKMKSCLSGEDEAAFVGFGGSEIDSRLAVRMFDAPDSTRPRARWNAAACRFELATSGAGVESFYLNDAFGRIDYGTEDRDPSAFAYNTRDGWIWRYSDSPPLDRQGPTPVALSATTMTVETTPASGAPVASDPVLSQLSAPLFSVSGGSYKPTQFPAEVSLRNPNPSTTSHILYSINGGDFRTYSGPLPLLPGTTITAFVTGDPSVWVPSATVEGLYTKAAPEPLATPSIATSAPQFAWDTVETVLVSISDSNDPTISSLQFQLGTAGWQTYSGEFALPLSSYPDGATIVARSVPLNEDYASSGDASAVIAPPAPPQRLLPPNVIASASNFLPSEIEAISITLEDLNKVGSVPEYRVNGGDWRTYSGTFGVTMASYPTGLLVEGRARAKSRAYLDSELSGSKIGLTPAKLKAPSILSTAPNFVPGAVETISITISDPNSSSFALDYRLNAGSWLSYRGSFQVTRASYPTGLSVEARARATSPAYVDSDITSSRIGLSQIQLRPPVVTPSAPNFMAGSVESITVAISNPNSAGSTLEYRLNGSTWRSYTAAFRVTRSTYPTGVLIEARARAVSTSYLDSPYGAASIGLKPVQLLAPVIRKSAPYFAPGVVESISITITNPNIAGSALEYRINNASWAVYSGSFNVTRSSYPSGLTIEARARATSTAYLTSPVASANILVNMGPVQKVTVTFSSLSSSAGYLNEAFIYVNGDGYYLGNSDMGAGTTVSVSIYVNPNVTNVFDLSIDTYMRSGSTITSAPLRGMDTRNGSQFTVIASSAAFAGAAPNAGKIKDLSTASNVRMVVGYEDLIITGGTPDYDYDDFMFDLKAPGNMNLIFGGYYRGM